MAVLVGLLLPILLGFGALAVDVGNLIAAKAELQAAADSTALATAACLRNRSECGNLSRPMPDWNGAERQASSYVQQNTSQGSQLQHVEVSSGYWNLTGTPPGLRSRFVIPGNFDVPAVQITLRRQPGENGVTDENGGPVRSILAGVFGVQASPLTATATAALSSPGTAAAGSLFPLAIAKCMYDAWWDSASGQPKLATSTSVPGFDLPQVIGQPYQFKITSNYKAGACESGQWTSFNIDNNSASFIGQLMATGNTSALQIGDSVWIQTGTKTTLYPDVNACSAAGNRKCEYVMLPVVSAVATQARSPIVGLACVRLLSATGGSGKYIVAHMSADPQKCQATGAGGFGPNYGMVLPPRLVM
jgi:hypothetical protein